MSKPAAIPRKGPTADFLLHTGLAATLLAGLYWLAFERPVAFITLVSEDYHAEYASAVAWWLASLVLLYRAVIDASGRSAVPLAIAFVAFAAGMEEVSWGQRILDIEVPPTFAEHNRQAELNVHNFVDDRWYLPVVWLGIVVYGLLLPVLARVWPFLALQCRRFGLPVPAGRCVPFFALALLLLTAPRDRLLLLRSQELGELLLALAIWLTMGWHVLAWEWGRRRGGMPSPPVGVGLSFVALAMSFLLAEPLVRAFDAPESLQRNLANYAALELPQMGMWNEASVAPGPRARSEHGDGARMGVGIARVIRREA